MAAVELTAIHKSFGATQVLRGVDLNVTDGEFLTLVGPSGCGKSTLIRVIAGLEAQDSGSVAIGGRPVDHLRAHERRVAMVFQSYALYPHMSVRQNIGLPLTMARLRPHERMPLLGLLSPRRRSVMREIDAEVRVIAAQLQLDALLDRRPAQLSGGQRQRVALGRAMVRHPDIFLMDEPLSNLDAKLRVHMRTELAELHQRLGTTFIYVTHDQVEAMTMSNRVAVMDGGNLLQVGTPAQVYDQPATLQVARFIGSPAINLLAATVGAYGQVVLDGRPLPLRVDQPDGANVTIGLRPEAMSLRAEVDDLLPWVAVRLRRKENLGNEALLHFDLLGELKGQVTLRSTSTATARPFEGTGDTLLGFHAADCHIFAAEGHRLRAQTLADPGEAGSRAMDRRAGAFA